MDDFAVPGGETVDRKRTGSWKKVMDWVEDCNANVDSSEGNDISSCENEKSVVSNDSENLDSSNVENRSSDIAQLKQLLKRLNVSNNDSEELSKAVMKAVLSDVTVDSETVIDQPRNDTNKEKASAVINSSLKDSGTEQESSSSSRYVYSDDFSQPSHGVILPYQFATKEEQIAWLMENDKAFRRGRLQWIARQERHKKNLEMREANKQKRRSWREDQHTDSDRSSNFRFAFNRNQSGNRNYCSHKRKTMPCQTEFTCPDPVYHNANVENRRPAYFERRRRTSNYNYYRNDNHNPAC